MLQLNLGSEADRLRTQLREWLQENPPPTVERECSLESFISTGKAWQKKLASGKWIAVHWPTEYGGRGLSLVEEAIVQEELSRVHAPQLLGLFGLTMVGPVLISHGSVEQKKRYLANILTADEVWCQGFSETQAGSDLAAVSTTAEPATGPRGEPGFRINGRKIWTSFAHVAHKCFLLARSFRGEKPHHGLSYLLLDMDKPGITIRPLGQITGEEEFNEILFEDVFVPRSDLVGEIGDGWKIAITTLMHERVILTFARHLQTEQPLREMIKQSNQNKISTSLREKLAIEAARFCATRTLAYSHLIKYAAGAEPGPEGSLDKLYWSEGFQRVAQLALDFVGSSAAGVPRSSDDLTDPAFERYLYSRGRTIAAGTSEIQRMIIAQRLLGLPRG
jgi:alkylation response protein AidB-like acyl-CoA dehydrogenase